jgi:hypothetical protein
MSAASSTKFTNLKTFFRKIHINVFHQRLHTSHQKLLCLFYVSVTQCRINSALFRQNALYVLDYFTFPVLATLRAYKRCDPDSFIAILLTASHRISCLNVTYKRHPLVNGRKMLFLKTASVSNVVWIFTRFWTALFILQHNTASRQT